MFFFVVFCFVLFCFAKVSNPITELVVTVKVCMILSHPWAYLAMLVIDIVYFIVRNRCKHLLEREKNNGGHETFV